MPTNRTPISRPRVPSFTSEILTVFAELQGTPPPRHWRKRQEYTRKSQHLASQLGLSDAWWFGLKVEKHEQQRPREGLAAHEWWPTIRRMRRQLLTALEQRDEHSAQQPADEHPAATPLKGCPAMSRCPASARPSNPGNVP
jgi:hypothetical protein